MTMTTLQSWTDRVLVGGRLGAVPDEDWKLVAYEHYRDKLRAPDYPCFFGQGGDGSLSRSVTSTRSARPSGEVFGPGAFGGAPAPVAAGYGGGVHAGF
jgi:hypothetical protein